MDMALPAEAKEQQRLDALDRYDVLDTPREDAFDRITRLVSHILGVPMSTITMIDGHRQWFKSHVGMPSSEGPRSSAFCNVVIQQDEPLVISDTLKDTRFASNENVTGGPRVRAYAGIPLRTPEGQNLGSLCAIDTQPREFTPAQLAMLSDLAALVMQGLELRRLASVDALTGAASRRAFREQAERAVALAQRHRHDLCAVAIDLDHFKAINDTHGHATGDAVLMATAAACRVALRTTDIFGRLGGEEFAVVLPHTGRAEAMNVAEKLREAIAREVVDTPSGTVAVTASFGVAMLDWSGIGLPGLLERADLALYAAKKGGRNRSVMWQGGAEAAAPSDARRRVLKAGRISFNGGRSSVDCTVRSLSETGAGLDVISTAGVPATFKLRIEADGLSKLCRVTEKKERHIELAFEAE